MYSEFRAYNKKNIYCTVTGCENFHHAKELCKKHYDAKRRLGVDFLKKMRKSKKILTIHFELVE